MPTDIRLLDRTLPTPAANLACDEALLELAELHDGPTVLRFWESAVPFIVVGYGARLSEEVHLDACRALAIPVLRRCSGGGTVLQGPGCLNYSVVLPLDAVGPEATITETNRFVMERHRAALSSLLGRPVAIAGHTDLVLENRKFSGNAQRRRRRWFLFHGTFLLSCDLELMTKTLCAPPRAPEYRQGRDHREFVAPISVSRERLKGQLRTVWNVRETLKYDENETKLDSAIARLVDLRYDQSESHEAGQ